MEILHVAAECYPYAKAGGLGDVVGALPKYQNQLGHIAKVIVPMHRTKFLYENEWEVVHKGNIGLGDWRMDYTIIKEKTNKLGFDLYCVDINGLLDRENIYSYRDDTERFLAFQVAVVDWIANWQHLPDIVHVHDHHAGLIPFMMQHCYAYNHLANIKTILTIHNAQYQGWMTWDKNVLLPNWDAFKWGNLDWDDKINPLASAVKCAWKVNTVSPSYMEEIRTNANGLETLFEYERGKCTGIINGIDNVVWDPAKDTFLTKNFSAKTVTNGKQKNKEALCKQFNLDPIKPLMIFIGRLVGEKAADILPETIKEAIYTYQGNVSFLVLGSGDTEVEHQLTTLNHQFAGYYNSKIAYNEALSHLMYAGADFILMPSRVEPCGLNQLYALRYGTIPMVRNTGGLKDTVIDIGDGGYGFKFNTATVNDLLHTIGRGVDFYFNNTEQLQETREFIMGLNYSWESSAAKYIALYGVVEAVG
jgi:starch synthase